MRTFPAPTSQQHVSTRPTQQKAPVSPNRAPTPKAMTRRVPKPAGQGQQATHQGHPTNPSGKKKVVRRVVVKRKVNPAASGSRPPQTTRGSPPQQARRPKQQTRPQTRHSPPKPPSQRAVSKKVVKSVQPVQQQPPVQRQQPSRPKQPLQTSQAMNTDDLPLGVGRVPLWWMEVTPHDKLDRDDDARRRQIEAQWNIYFSQVEDDSEFGGIGPDGTVSRNPPSGRHHQRRNVKVNPKLFGIDKSNPNYRDYKYGNKVPPEFVGRMQEKFGEQEQLGGMANNRKQTEVIRKYGHKTDVFQPSWAKMKLRETGQGNDIRGGGDIANPITYSRRMSGSHNPVLEDLMKQRQPSEGTRLVRKTRLVKKNKYGEIIGYVDPKTIQQPKQEQEQPQDEPERETTRFSSGRGLSRPLVQPQGIHAFAPPATSQQSPAQPLRQPSAHYSSSGNQDLSLVSAQRVHQTTTSSYDSHDSNGGETFHNSVAASGGGYGGGGGCYSCIRTTPSEPEKRSSPKRYNSLATFVDQGNEAHGDEGYDHEAATYAEETVDTHTFDLLQQHEEEQEDQENHYSNEYEDGAEYEDEELTYEEDEQTYEGDEQTYEEEVVEEYIEDEYHEEEYGEQYYEDEEYIDEHTVSSYEETVESAEYQLDDTTDLQAILAAREAELARLQQTY